LYAMLTGGPPFGMEGATDFYIKDCHVRTPPPPLVYLNPDIPPAIGEVAFRCLEKDPAKRFPTCGAVMTALEAAISGETPEEKPPDPPPPPVPDPPPAGGLKKYALIGAAAILLISATTYFLIAPGAHRKKLLESKDWSHARWNDSDFSDCMGVAACLAKKSQAENLENMKTSQWRQAPYNSPLFDDCMGYPACTLQKAHRDKLIATRDWANADKGLLSDCMGYLPCLQGGQHTAVKKLQPKGETLDPENLPTCCTKSSDPAACRAIKRREQIPDCSSPMDQRLVQPTVPPQN
jgi:hypothetical protein